MGDASADGSVPSSVYVIVVVVSGEVVPNVIRSLRRRHGICWWGFRGFVFLCGDGGAPSFPSRRHLALVSAHYVTITGNQTHLIIGTARGMVRVFVGDGAAMGSGCTVVTTDGRVLVRDVLISTCWGRLGEVVSFIDSSSPLIGEPATEPQRRGCSFSRVDHGVSETRCDLGDCGDKVTGSGLATIGRSDRQIDGG